MTIASRFRPDVTLQSSRSSGQRQRRTLPPAAIVPLCVVTLATGCAATARPGEIPLGQWSGEGTFVYEHWKSGDGEPDPDDRVSLTRDYSTTLTVKKSALDDRDIIKMEILSKRGELPGLHIDDESHLVLALIQAKRVSDSAVLYRMVAAQFNPSGNEELKVDDSAPPISASCTTRGDVTILQLQYGENFVDTFRFRGRHLEKNGFWFNPDEGFVHWYERLHKRP